ARGMRVIGDLTTNHTGDAHEWFRAAQADRGSVTAGFYYWADDVPFDLHRWQQSLADQWGGEVASAGWVEPVDYVTWLGVASLPKLNWGSQELWDRMLRGPGSVVGRYLRPPFGLDGWRIDVAHMTGRFAADDYHDAVARAIRATIDATGGLLVGEHFYDVYNDQLGDGWQSVMNYQGFIKPLWSWLTRPDSDLRFADLPVPIPRRPATDVVATMRDFDGSVPWRLSSRQWNMLGSHDTARIATVTADPRLVEVGAAWLFTYPGIPALFAGDEGGAVGVNGENSRTTMPWDQIDAGGGPRWDGAAFQRYRSLIRLRRASTALQDGGLRWAVITPDAVAYLRETAGERLLVVLARAPWQGTRLPRWLLADGATPELLYGGSAAATPTLTVEDALSISGEGPAVGVWRLE
ncbi:MAG: alpha-amylase family glycosyl hydrolase, partial [Propionicimonas sp.]|nr:alpha-amylase family glycosyl hydrolase [Propionicimonas sp.]